MFDIIERYISNLTKDDIRNFALSKGINLSISELDYTYNFIKKNYDAILRNPRLFNIERYREHYEKENFDKIVKVYHEYLNQYGNYL